MLAYVLGNTCYADVKIFYNLNVDYTQLQSIEYDLIVLTTTTYIILCEPKPFL